MLYCVNSDVIGKDIKEPASAGPRPATERKAESRAREECSVGILDELRKEAENNKQTTGGDAKLAQRREQTYQQILLPVMKRMLNSIQELLEYLQTLDPVAVDSYSVNRPEIGKLLQGDYRLNTDGMSGFEELNKLRQINLSFRLKGAGFYKYTIMGKLAAETELQFLHQRKVKVETKSEAGPNGVLSTTFTVERDIPVSMSFVVDYENSSIKFTEHNQENFSSSAQSFGLGDLSKDWIDQFLRFLLRKDNDFVASLKRRMPT
jgi:hypothetical protein